MRRRFLAGSTNLFGGGDKISTVTEERLDLRIHRENCCREIPNDDEEYARRAEIRMFPPVRSQGAGTPFLDSAEVSILGWARRTALIGNDIPEAMRVGWPGKPLSQAQWRRISGFDSFEAFAQAGAPYFLWDTAMGLVYSPEWRGSGRASIRTKRLWLLPTNLEILHAELEGRHGFESLLGVRVPDSWPPEPHCRSAVEYTISRFTGNPQQRGWWVYYVVLDTDSSGRHVYPALLGTAGYKGLPDPDGTVELDVAVLPEYRRRGIATEATLGLVDHAFNHGTVERVIAETLVENVPSIGVLQKCGFHPKGDGSKPAVIRYELTRDEYKNTALRES